MPNTINDIHFSDNFPQWAKPEQMDVSFVDMSDASVSYSIKVPAGIEHKFNLGWWIEVRGEKFYNSTLKPNGYKDASSLMYNYTLVFNSERNDLKRYIWVDIDKQSGVPLIKSYLNVFKLTLSQFADKFNDNLSFYRLSNRWKIEVEPTLAARNEQVMVNVENAVLWDVLQQTTTLYGDVARWSIEPVSDKLVIKVGFPAVEINHIFEYGGDTPDGQGGLVKIERSLDTEKLTTILAGRGGERNIPERYFEPSGDNFPADPDANAYTSSLNLKNLMPKCFRDYNRGWNSKELLESESKAYNQGVTDPAYRPIEWVTSDKGTETYGDIWDRLEPKEEIFPTIQGVTGEQARAAGVVTSAVGRLDEIIAVETITGSDDPTSKEYKSTFNIWIKDIGFDLRRPEYWSKDEMSVVFTSGWLGVSEDYEFKVAGIPKDGGGYKEVYVYPDATKTNIRGERSAWRIGLIKIDAELDATGKMLPNATASGNAIEGDNFFFINIQLPHSYVLIAEKRQEDYLADALSKIDHEVPVYSIDPDRIFCANFNESDKLNVGALVRVANAKLIDGVYETLHLQSITLKYNFKDKMLPDWTMVVTDQLLPSLNPVQRLAADISSLTQGIGGTGDTSSVIAIGDKRWLRKDGTADLSQSNTNFRKDLTFHRFTKGQLTGTGGSIYQEDGKTTLELDSLRVRREMYVNELIIDQTSWIGGRKIFSMAAIENCTEVEDKGTFYRCYFDTKEDVDTKEPQVRNHFVIGDQAYCQRFDPLNSTTIIKYYWRLVVGKGENYIDLSKSDKDGSGLPEKHDDIIQIGNRNSVTRQFMYEIDVTNGGSTYTYAGINSFSFANKRYIGSGVNMTGDNTGEAFMFIYGDLFIGDRDMSDPGASFMTYQKKAGTTKKKLYIQAELNIGAGSTGLGNLSEWKAAQGQISSAQASADQAAAKADAAGLAANAKPNHFTNTSNNPPSGARIGDTWAKQILINGSWVPEGTIYTYFSSGWQLTGDNTVTRINGGITTGSVFQAGSGNTIKAGMSGYGTSDSDVRFWSGSGFDNLDAAKFKVLQSGKAIMSDAEVEGRIKASSGEIGNFKIVDGGLTNDPSLDNAYIAFKYTPASTYAAIGSRVYPIESGMRAISVFTNEGNNPYGINTALILSAKNGRSNDAISMLAGSISGFALNVKRIVASQSLIHEDCYLTCYNSIPIRLTLPSPSSSQLGKVYYIKTMNDVSVILVGKLYISSEVGEASIGYSRGDAVMLINDGLFWCYNYMPR